MTPPPPTFEEVCDRALKLPCSPTLLPRLITTLYDEASTAADIEKIIQLDSALAAATLRLANSAHYGNREPVAVLEEAVIRLGQREIYRLAAQVLVSRWEDEHKDNLPWEPGDYSRHSVCVALAAEVLAETSRKIDPPVAYTAGLVCDIGKLALAYACARFFPAIKACCRESTCTWEQAEKKVIGYTHAEIGAQLLTRWNFPQEYPLVVAHQFNPSQAPKEALPLLAHLHAARYLAVSMGPGVSEDGFLFDLQGAFLAEWGFTPEVLEDAMIEVQQRAMDLLGGRINLGSLGQK